MKKSLFCLCAAMIAISAIRPAHAQSIAQTGAQPSGAPIKIVALGDSLTAGYMLPESAAFPQVLERRLRAMGFDVRIANAGVSGDTASGVLERLDWSTPEGTQLVILEAGANDMLRAIDPKATRAALDEVLAKLQARKIVPALAGMKSMANWGENFRAAFEAIYPDLSRKYAAPLYPFFLEGVAGDKSLLLPDGLHPNARGVEKIVDGFAPFLAEVLRARLIAPQTPTKAQ